MRISGWSSDVCSSDLLEHLPRRRTPIKREGEGDGELVPMLAGPGGICMIDYLPSEPFCNFVEEFPAFNRVGVLRGRYDRRRSEEHTSELQSLMRISYAVFCLNKKNMASTYVATE